MTTQHESALGQNQTSLELFDGQPVDLGVAISKDKEVIHRLHLGTSKRCDMMSLLDAYFGNMNTTINQRRYLGSKTKLLNFIEEILDNERVQFNSFADIFAGTGVVAHHFQSRADVIVNDILESNRLCYVAFLGKNKIRKSWLNSRLEYYNNIKSSRLSENYFSRNFSNTYFDADNCRKIGYIREDIEKLHKKGIVNERERAYLIVSLIYALDRIANTVGHYDAYRKIELSQKPIELKPLDITPTRHNAVIHKMDANELVKNISADVVYIDPPYNSRQYSDAYHLLENIACWEKKKVFGVARKIDRSGLKSAYSLKSAGIAFCDLINNIDAKYILVSYNDMGTNGNARSQSRISDHEIMTALQRRGQVKIFEKEFNQFTTGRSTNNDLKERVFFCHVLDDDKPHHETITSRNNSHLPEFVKSPLNYTGGKHKLLPQLFDIFPNDIDTFYDIFCGGANVGINAVSKKIVCVDKDPHVISLLNYLKQENFNEINHKILEIISRHKLSQSYIHGYEVYGAESTTGLGQYNKRAFQNLRSEYNTHKGKDKSALLMTLILYGFNNQIRFNTRGEFNLPVGRRDYNGCSRKNLANFNAVSNAKCIEFIKGDFRDLKQMQFNSADFIYLDPPYLLGLAAYNESGGWSVNDERELYGVLESLHLKGVRFALSNVTEHKGKTNAILLDFVKRNRLKIHPINHSYKNSNYQSKAKANTTREVLVVNYSK